MSLGEVRSEVHMAMVMINDQCDVIVPTLDLIMLLNGKLTKLLAGSGQRDAATLLARVAEMQAGLQAALGAGTMAIGPATRLLERWA